MTLDEWCQHYAVLAFMSITVGMCIAGYIVCIITERK